MKCSLKIGRRSAEQIQISEVLSDKLPSPGLQLQSEKTKQCFFNALTTCYCIGKLFLCTPLNHSHSIADNADTKRPQLVAKPGVKHITVCRLFLNQTNGGYGFCRQKVVNSESNFWWKVSDLVFYTQSAIIVISGQ